MKILAHYAPRCSSGRKTRVERPATRSVGKGLMLALAISIVTAGCETTPAPKSEELLAAKPAEPAVPAEIQSAADALLGSETKVLAYGDLAKTGKQQLLAANLVPKTP